MVHAALPPPRYRALNQVPVPPHVAPPDAARTDQMHLPSYRELPRPEEDDAAGAAGAADGAGREFTMGCVYDWALAGAEYDGADDAGAGAE